MKKALRNELFRYLDGLGTGPSTYVLYKHGVLDYVLEQQEVDIITLSNKFSANEGYLNVAMRILVSQGWLNQELNNENDQIIYSINNKSKIAFKHCWLYEDVFNLLVFSGKYHSRNFEEAPFLKWLEITEKFKQSFGIEFSEDSEIRAIQEQILKHIEGILVAPTVVALGMNGMFHKYFMEHSFHPAEFHEDEKSFIRLLDFFVHLEWFAKKGENYQFTEKGLFFAKRATSFGVTVSYNPNYRNMEQLLFGDPTKLREIGIGETEKHVDRKMNVWGSGGSHGAYFKKVDEIIISLFNKPISEQPKGILDMGCGNGAYLKHLFDVIEQRTERGKMLDDYPLFLVGVDYNTAALKVTRANLIKSDIWAKVIWGDIGRPDVLAKDLKEGYDIDINDLLNVRSLLDHNRPWSTPNGTNESAMNSLSTGAFAHRGKRLNNNLVELNLLEHFKKWGPYIKKFGLLLIELHTVNPILAAQNLGHTAATAYDSTHGFSDQYIVELEVFHKVAKMAGLQLDENNFAKFPNNDLATISINLFR